MPGAPYGFPGASGLSAAEENSRNSSSGYYLNAGGMPTVPPAFLPANALTTAGEGGVGVRNPISGGNNNTGNNQGSGLLIQCLVHGMAEERGVGVGNPNHGETNFGSFPAMVVPVSNALSMARDRGVGAPKSSSLSMARDRGVGTGNYNNSNKRSNSVWCCWLC